MEALVLGGEILDLNRNAVPSTGNRFTTIR
jgi:hypothetical protein